MPNNICRQSPSNFPASNLGRRQHQAVPAGRECQAHSGERGAHPHGAATGGSVHQGVQDGRKRESAVRALFFFFFLVWGRFPAFVVVVAIAGERGEGGGGGGGRSWRMLDEVLAFLR